MTKYKYFLTFKQDAPAGYRGTHGFFTMKEQRAFVERFEQRTRERAIDWIVHPQPQEQRA
jgi:hypothetical protein